MNETETILAGHEVTPRNVVFVGHSSAWFIFPLERDDVPRLHWAGPDSILRDTRWAFRVGRLFASGFQARLWCAYHGFEFIESELMPLPPGFFRQYRERWPRRLRPCDEFRVQKYRTHRERCPDCQRFDREREGASIGVHMEASR